MGISMSYSCAGNDDVFTFAKNILDEVIPLFDSEYVHIGGDEAPGRWWKQPKVSSNVSRP